MRFFILAVYRFVQIVLAVALFPVFCMLFRLLVVGLAPDLTPLQRDGINGVTALVLTAMLTPTGQFFMVAVACIARYGHGLKSQDARMGLTFSFAASMAAGLLVANACRRGTGAAELPAAIVAALVLGGLGTLVLYLALRRSDDLGPSRVVAGAQATSYAEMRRREHRDADF